MQTGKAEGANRERKMPNDSVNRKMRGREWGLLLILSVIFGGSFFFIEIAVRSLSPITIVFTRVGMASVILLLFIRMTGRKMPAKKTVWGAFFIMGALNNLIPFSLIIWAQQHIDSSLASILNATTPIFSLVLAHFLTKEEKMTRNRLAGVLVGWMGVAVLIGVETLKGPGIQVIGQLAVLGAACCYAFAAIFGRRFKGMDPVVVSAGMLCASTLMIAPIAVALEQPWHYSPAWISWSAVVALAVISTSLAYIIYFHVLGAAGATNLLLVTFLIPVSATFLGVVFLGERPGWNAFAGMGLIFAGLAAIDGRMIPIFKTGVVKKKYRNQSASGQHRSRYRNPLLRLGKSTKTPSTAEPSDP